MIGGVPEPHDATVPESRGGAKTTSRSVIVARAVLLLVAGGALVVAVSIARRDLAAPSAGPLYVCPMHSQVTATMPGTCPICGMTLTRGPETVGESPLRGPLIPLKTLEVTTAIHAPAFTDGGDQVVALMHRDEVASLGADEKGVFTSSPPVDTEIEVIMSGDAPSRHSDSTVLVRFRMATPRPELRPRTVGSLALAPRPRRLLLVPSDGVIDSPEGPYLLVASADGRTFTKRSVTIGGSYSTYTVLLAGAEAGERVAVADAFLVDAERRLRSDALAAPPKAADP